MSEYDYDQGYSAGISAGYDDGYRDGREDGLRAYAEDLQDSYNKGFDEGYDAANADACTKRTFISITTELARTDGSTDFVQTPWGWMEAKR